jgi:hypothetical protein
VSAHDDSEIVSVRRFPLRELSPEDFERLCTYIVTMDFPDARRLAPPDRGADAIAPRDGAAVRVWQFKRMGHQISWPKCVESLDVAVEHHAPVHVTFCFPRDLTAAQLLKFKAELQDRHPGLLVDWWGETYLVGRLLSGPQGERIARAFFQDPAKTTEVLLAAVTAGSPLETGSDVARVLAAIGSRTAQDPDFHYSATVREVGSPSTSWS